MKVQGLSKQAMRFKSDGRNFDIPDVSDSGVLLQFIEIGNWIKVMIQVDEDTTSDDLRKAIPMALSWRDRLLEWQGPWMLGGDNPFLEQLSLRQKAGETYRNLANHINQEAASWVHSHVAYTKELEAVQHSFKTMFDFYMWESKANPFSLDHARHLLRAVRLKDDKIDGLLTTAVDNVQAGKPAFEAEYPVSRDALISALRLWRSGRKHKVLASKRGW